MFFENFVFKVRGKRESSPHKRDFKKRLQEGKNQFNIQQTNKRIYLDVAKLLLREGKYLDMAVFHIHQAIEKHLKGYLISKGWVVKKIHDLESPITEAMKFDATFQKFLGLGRKLTAFYYGERYPPRPATSYSEKEVREMLEEAEKLVKKLKEETHQK
ncbi:MAG: HEPN domain-containing protein [Candidatus Freyarchaeota archaeon]|nr:HEPN domain-containing protein [Candidatus Jordarchaeia archaeon]MBS7270045.1 HEPN domain-containing protein [Candidatus Jordarchaeia archaeon]MBS7280489.1 HEPN domain-containing protein [Candidatus Jordarchaeia archaeon]